MLNKQKGNMFNFINFTWNPVKGVCPHSCRYCYMKKFPQGPLKLDKKCLKDNLGSGNFIFVGSSTDMFAERVPSEWIGKTLLYCEQYQNTYLFQSKNPARFSDFYFPESWLGTTIETNREDLIEGVSPLAPQIVDRVEGLKNAEAENKMITIEPIMDFDHEPFVELIRKILPDQVNIGADSGGNNLQEPDSNKIKALISSLEEFTKVVIKYNLKRLYHG